MPVDRRLIALVDRQAAAHDQLTARVIALIARLWQNFDDPYDDDLVLAIAARFASIITSGQRQSAQLSGRYLAQVLGILGTRPPTVRPSLPPAPRGVPPTEVYTRPAEEYRYLVSQGVTPIESKRRSAERAQVIAGDDLKLASRMATREVYEASDEVEGYRRVIRPELSRTGTCGLCLAASDRVYSKEDLLPIHDRCHCITLPIVGANDPGRELSQAELEDVYARAGGTQAAKLKRVRYQVHEHGELGPVLRNEEHRFRGPAQVRRDTVADPRKQITAQLTALESSYARLQERQAAGEDVTRPLAWQRSRIAELRRTAA